MYPLMWTMPMASCFLKKTFTKTLWETNQSQFWTWMSTLSKQWVFTVKSKFRKERKCKSLFWAPLKRARCSESSCRPRVTASSWLRAKSEEKPSYTHRDILEEMHWIILDVIGDEKVVGHSHESHLGDGENVHELLHLWPLCAKKWHEDLCDFFFPWEPELSPKNYFFKGVGGLWNCKKYKEVGVKLQNIKVQIVPNWKHLSNREANRKLLQLTTEWVWRAEKTKQNLLDTEFPKWVFPVQSNWFVGSFGCKRVRLKSPFLEPHLYLEYLRTAADCTLTLFWKWPDEIIIFC